MPRISNTKLLRRKAGEDYTAAEYEEIRRTQLLLREAEFALRNANRLWKEVITLPGPVAIVKEVMAIELGKKESLAVMGHRMVQHARHIRWEARRNLRLAYGQYASAVNRPLALKRMAKLMSGYIRERLEQPSFAERILPVMTPEEIAESQEFDLAGHPEWGNPHYCPVTQGEHMPETGSITPVKGESLVDVTCCNCGRSGAVVVNLEDAQW